MLRRTLQCNLAKTQCKFTGGAPAFIVQPKKYVRHMPYNPWFGAKHDGFSSGYCQGFTAIDIPHLYRFRHNVLPIARPLGRFSHNPMGKNVHYLEVNVFDKFSTQIFNEESLPHTTLATIIFTIITLHLCRYLYAHPDVTWYNLVLWPTKPHVEMYRWNDMPTFDQPVFRFFQRPCEFYAYDTWREMVSLGVCANDPWVDYVKSIGREKDLYFRPDEKHVGLFPPPKPSSGHH